MTEEQETATEELTVPYDLIERSGIRRADISNRFDDVVQVLTSTIGISSRVIVQRTVVEMFKEDSQRIHFSYTDPLREPLALLKDQAISNDILRRTLHDESTSDRLERRDLA